MIAAEFAYLDARVNLYARQLLELDQINSLIDQSRDEDTWDPSHADAALRDADGHRSMASLQNEAARRGFSARNDLTQRMSKPLAGKLKALTMNRHLPASLRFHSLSVRQRAMVGTTDSIPGCPGPRRPRRHAARLRTKDSRSA